MKNNFFKRFFKKTNENIIFYKNKEIMVDLDVTKERIIYNFDEYCCYKKLTETCSLELTEPIKLERLPEINKKEFNHCKNLAKDILKNGVTRRIFIYKGKDETCTISDGQHRVCICQHLGIKVPSHLSLPEEISYKYEEEK